MEIIVARLENANISSRQVFGESFWCLRLFLTELQQYNRKNNCNIAKIIRQIQIMTFLVCQIEYIFSRNSWSWAKFLVKNLLIADRKQNIGFFIITLGKNDSKRLLLTVILYVFNGFNHIRFDYTHVYQNRIFILYQSVYRGRNWLIVGLGLILYYKNKFITTHHIKKQNKKPFIFKYQYGYRPEKS